MACKCIRKLTLVMMELLIFLLIKVQANNLVHPSFSPSRLPILYPHFSHFSEFDEVQGTIHTCFASEIEDCEKIWPLHSCLSINCLVLMVVLQLVNINAEEKMTLPHTLYECLRSRTQQY